MSFSKGLNFPFSNNNLNKILQIGLILGLISAVQFAFGNSEGTGFGSLVAGIANILFALFVSGYGISVMQNILRDQEILPNFDIGNSIGRGFMILIASLIYILPLIIIFSLIIFMIISMSGASIDYFFEEISRSLDNPNYVPDTSQFASETLGMLPLMTCGLMLILIPMSFILSFAIQVGMVRFAAEDRSAALFEFGKNIGLVFKNFGKMFKLFFNQFGLGIIYGIITFIIAFAVGIFLGVGGFSDAQNDPIMFTLIGSIVLVVISTILSTAQQMSNLHLLAGIGEEMGLAGKSKYKNDDHYDF